RRAGGEDAADDRGLRRASGRDRRERVQRPVEARSAAPAGGRRLEGLTRVRATARSRAARQVACACDVSGAAPCAAGRRAVRRSALDPSPTVPAARRMRPTLVVNPTADEPFATRARALVAEGVVTIDALQTALREA